VVEYESGIVIDLKLNKLITMKAIEIITIPVADQEKAKEFYLKLGFKILVEAPADHGQTWVQMGLPGQSTSISLLTFHGIIVETADIDKEIAELKAKGIEVGKIDTKPWGKFAWLKDPDGNGICLHQK
jgi:catechol 2,3-dioxygenase-like lactoylglutathione lyase family enzyme